MAGIPERVTLLEEQAAETRECINCIHAAIDKLLAQERREGMYSDADELKSCMHCGHQR